MTEGDIQEGFRELQERIDRLEQYTGLASWQPTPGFDVLVFHRVLVGYLMRAFLPTCRACSSASFSTR